VPGFVQRELMSICKFLPLAHHGMRGGTTEHFSRNAPSGKLQGSGVENGWLCRV
jgi:hypothetical protein